MQKHTVLFVKWIKQRKKRVNVWLRARMYWMLVRLVRCVGGQCTVHIQYVRESILFMRNDRNARTFIISLLFVFLSSTSKCTQWMWNNKHCIQQHIRTQLNHSPWHFFFFHLCETIANSFPSRAPNWFGAQVNEVIWLQCFDTHSFVPHRFNFIRIFLFTFMWSKIFQPFITRITLNHRFTPKCVERYMLFCNKTTFDESNHRKKHSKPIKCVELQWKTEPVRRVFYHF